MKLIKRIGITAIFLVMLFPVSNVFAESNLLAPDYTKGLLDNSNIVKSNDLPVEQYDNDLETSALLLASANSSYHISFRQPINIDGVYIDGGQSNLTFIFDDGNDSTISDLARGYNNVIYNNVIGIELKRENDSFQTRINEIDFFGTYDEDYVPPVDSGGDGIPDSEDEYPEDPTNTPPPVDSDGDGIPDNEDEYPDDPADGKPLEVRNLQMEVTEKRVDLSWEKPPSNFDKAIIYRKKLGTTQTATIFDLLKPMTVSAAEEYIPLFETNGTTFSDLTIEPETEYQYKVTSEFNGIESEGVTTTVSIPKAPPIDFSEIEMPFGVKELITSGNGLLGIIAGFVLLALSFVFVPKVIRLIKSAFRTPEYKGQPMAERIQQDRETEKANRQQAKAERREKREARAGRQSSYIPREPRQSKRG